MEIQRMFDNLLCSINWEEAAQHSYRNFHAAGLHYLNLLRTPRLTVKLYTFENVKHNSHGYLVWPHNHAYNFCHRTLAGVITNHNFDLAPEGHGGVNWDLYQFETPLNGGDGLTKLLPCGLTELQSQELAVGQSYYLDREQIHTLSINTPEYAAALLLQFHDIKKVTAMFAPQDEDPNCDSGLYYRLQAWQGRQLVERFDEETKGCVA